MVEQHYISNGLSHGGDLAEPDGLPGSGRSSCGPPSNSNYPDLTPFSAVSPFNIASQCDSNLMTPISTAASPPLQQAPKLVRQQYPPPVTPYAQVPTPPGSSKMYHHQWNNQFDMNSHTSQASSPMTTQAPIAPEFYISDGRRTPGPPDPYLGAFGVSTGPEPQPIQHAGPPYYLDVQQMDNQNAMMMRDNHQMSMDRSAPPPGAPLLSQAHPSHFRPNRRLSGDNHGHADPNRHTPPSGSPRRRPTQGSTRVKKSRSTKRQSAAVRNNPQPLDPSDEHTNCYGEEAAPHIKSNCPEEERCIFESRWRHRRQRGQDMWESIQNDFLRQFNKSHGKEMLQMKFKRGRSKYIEWLPKDEAILLEAWKQLEKDRYQTLLDNFVRLGGSRNMLLSASDIEIKVVNDLKLEEPLYIDGIKDMDLRRRRRAVIKKRSNGRGEPGGEVPVSDEMLNLGTHPTHNEEDVVTQVHGSIDPRWEEVPTTNGEMIDVHMWSSRAPMKTEPGVGHHNEQMARQACEQLLKVHNTSSSLKPNGAPQALYQTRRGS